MKTIKKVVFLMAATIIALILLGCEQELTDSTQTLEFMYDSEVSMLAAYQETDATEEVLLFIEKSTESTAEATNETLTEDESAELTTKENAFEATTKESSQTVSNVAKKTESIHTHHWNDTVYEPTCTTAGYIHHSCSCGTEDESSHLPATGHTWSSWNTVIEATTVADGKAERECTSCQETENRIIEKLTASHKHSYASSITTNATCSQPGVITFVCSCGDSYTEDIAKLNHDYLAKATTSTCTTRGYTVYTCKVCGTSYQDDFTALKEHQYKVVILTPTCSRVGYSTHICEICEVSYVDNYKEKLPHTWMLWNVAKEATETTTGIKERICYDCGTKETETIDKLAHTHSYHEEITRDANCETVGIKTFTCSCGNSYNDIIAVTDHTWGEWRELNKPTFTQHGVMERTCKICGSFETKTLEKLDHHHSYTSIVTTAATCETDGVRTFTCSCGDSYTERISYLGHGWSRWFVSTEPTETSTGIQERTCSKCGKTETQILPVVEHTHSMKHVKTRPNCTEEGYTTHTCVMCGYSYVDTYVPTTGHTWGDWTTVVAPTTSSAGRSEKMCSECYLTESKVLEMLHSHNYSNTLEYVAATCTSNGYAKKACSCGDIITETLSGSHDWVNHHTDEVGHYVPRIVCHCGWSCSAEGDYISTYAAHIDTLPEEEKWTHSYYEGRDWVVDVPARDWSECSRCGAEH